MENNDRFDIAQLVEIGEVEIPIQQVIVNGVPQVINGTGYALVCPNCKQIIMTLPQGISYVEAVKSLNSDNEEELKKSVFCQTCGQKLKLLREPPIDIEL